MSCNERKKENSVFKEPLLSGALVRNISLNF